MDFKDRLRYYREQRGYSSDELAKLLDIPYTTLKGYENAGREPKYNILIKIADILNVSLDDLLGRTPTNEDEKIKELYALKNGDIDILSISLNNIKKDCVLFDIYLYDNKNISADKKNLETVCIFKYTYFI